MFRVSHQCFVFSILVVSYDNPRSKLFTPLGSSSCDNFLVRFKKPGSFISSEILTQTFYLSLMTNFCRDTNVMACLMLQALKVSLPFLIFVPLVTLGGLRKKHSGCQEVC